MKSTKLGGKSLFISLLLLAILILIVNVSLNFTILGIFAILSIFFICNTKWFNLYTDGRSIYGQELYPPIIHPRISEIASCIIVIFTILTMITLHNYFYADGIYRNNEHHALKISGVKISNPNNFVLIENNDLAFFDDEKFHGSLVIDSYNNENVTLRYEDFTHPIYAINRINELKDIHKENFPYSSIKNRDKDKVFVIQNNPDDIISFGVNEVVTFVNKNGDSLEFILNEWDLEKSLNPLNHNPDSASYSFKVCGNEWQTSKFTKLLVQGYSFNNLLFDVDIDSRKFDFSGINITRQIADYYAKSYEKSLNRKTQYALELCNEAFGNDDNKIEKILIGNTTFVLDDRTKCSGKITIPMKQQIFIGYGDHQTRTFSFEYDTLDTDNLKINFKESIYQGINAISGKRENTLYVTNSIIKDTENAKNDSEDIGINVPNNVLLFDFFNHSNNKNIFHSFYLSFSSGKTTESMEFIWNDGVNCDTINGNDNQHVYVKSDSNLSWIFSIDNLREKTNFGSRKMMIVVMIVGLLSSLLINFSQFFGGNNPYKYNRNTFSYVEFVAYIVVIYFIAFRCFLMWRATVFRPLENISEHEWGQIFNNNKYYVLLLCSLGLFFGVIALIKTIILVYKDAQLKEFYNKGYSPLNIAINDTIYENFLSKPIYSIIHFIGIDNLFYNFFGKNCFDKKIFSWKKIIILLYIVYPVIAVGIDNSRIALTLIVIWYFLIDIIINSKCGHKITLNNNSDDKYEAVSSLIYTFLNMGLATISMIIDSGFMVMFLTFCIISFCIKLLDLYTRIYNEKNGQSIKIVILYIVLFIIVFLILIFFNKIVLKAFEGRSFILIASLLLFALFFLICRYTEVKKIKQGYKVIFTILHIIIFGGIVTGAILSIADINLQTIFAKKSKSTIQRINVQLLDPHKAILSFKDNDDEIKFLQASHNDWIIEQYNRRSKDVDIIGRKGLGYFEIHPQSKLGAMWNAQLSDIVILRYVITEHGKTLPYIFLVLFIIMIYYGMRTSTYFRYSRSLLIQIPLLLFTQALLVWLANTQQFTFFGQDFPFISISAKIMLVYVFVLITIWVSVAIIESVMYRCHTNADLESLNEFNINSSKNVLVAFCIVASFYLIYNSIQFRKNENKDSKYEMETLFKESEPYVSAIDALFTRYQKEEYLEIKNNMHSEIVDFNNKYGKIICDTLKYISDTLAKQNGNPSDSANYNFIKRTWDIYVKKGSFNNSYNSLLRVYKPDSILHISMREDYYDLTLPNRYNETWKGNIIESRDTIIPKDTIIENDYYTYYQIPIDWVQDGQSYHMLKTTGRKDIEVFSLSTNQKIKLDKNGIRQVVALYDNDDYAYVEKELIDIPIEKTQYWARNILVNGKRSFIYPAGKEFYWIHDFAHMVKTVEETSSDELDNDVPITIDRELTAELYDELLESTRKIVNENTSDTLAQRSVIVVDGNGHIKAMVDYKYGYMLNPNDYETISELSEELFMNATGDRVSKESNYFENRNLAHLRGGPGSSQKPLVWAAVASAIDYDWKNLTLVGIYGKKVTTDNNNKAVQNSHYMLYKFNRDIVAEFRSLGSDERVYVPREMRGTSYGLEDCPTKDIGLKHYLAYSSNYYSALMVYLGLHSSDLYINNNFININGNINDTTTHAFRKFKDPSSISNEEYCGNYPFMRVGDGEESTIVTLGKPIIRNHLNNSVIYKQMEKMGMENTYKGGRDKGMLYTNYFIDSVKVKDKNQYKDIYFGSTTPAVSSISFNKFEYTKANAVDGWGFVHTNNIVRSIATGDGAAWNVTPLKMAEMYGKMFIMNSAFSCTMNPNEQYHVSDSTNIGKGYRSFDEALPIMYQSMNLFFSEGTGNKIRHYDNVDYRNVELPIMYPESDSSRFEYKGKTYYIYGKTGTTNGIQRTKDDHYSLLKIHFTSNQHIIKRGYDKVKADEQYYNSRKDEIDRAYNTLKNENSRQNYNKTLNKEHRRLAIIISDRNMNEKGAKPNKFYILYFTYDYKYKYELDIESVRNHMGETSYNIIEKVIMSECFQNYMNN